jgi:hypothetical protein
MLLVAVLAGAGGWAFLHFKKHAPAAAFAHSSLLPIDRPTTFPAVQKIVQNASATQPAVAEIAASQPSLATRTRVRVVAPPPGGLAVPPPTTQPVPPPQGTLDSTASTGGPPALPGPLANLMIPLSGSLPAAPPPAGEFGPSTLHHTTGPATAPALAKLPDKHADKPAADKLPANTAKNTPASQPAAKPERIIASAASVAQQFHVSCIMFGDQGSTAIINGSPVKVGQTIRADGVAKTGLPEEAVVKKIERNCVEVELNGEAYLLRI